jgi:hypothetical protein
VRASFNAARKPSFMSDGSLPCTLISKESGVGNDLLCIVLFALLTFLLLALLTRRFDVDVGSLFRMAPHTALVGKVNDVISNFCLE